MFVHAPNGNFRFFNCIRWRTSSSLRRSNFVSTNSSSLVRGKSRFSTHQLSSRKRLRALVSAALAHEGPISLSTYNLDYQRVNYLFEKCLLELMKHLEDDSILQSVQVANELTFHRERLNPNLQLNEIDLNLDSDIFMLCQPIPKQSSNCNLLPGNSISNRQLLAGKVGDCCDEHSVHDGVENEVTQFWGLVIQSSMFPGMQGCYLLKTAKVMSHETSDCHCMHYSLRKVSKGTPLSDQYDASWLV